MYIDKRNHAKYPTMEEFKNHIKKYSYLPNIHVINCLLYRHKAQLQKCNLNEGGGSCISSLEAPRRRQQRNKVI